LKIIVFGFVTALMSGTINAIQSYSTTAFLFSSFIWISC